MTCDNYYAHHFKNGQLVPADERLIDCRFIMYCNRCGTKLYGILVEPDIAHDGRVEHVFLVTRFDARVSSIEYRVTTTQSTD